MLSFALKSSPNFAFIALAHPALFGWRNTLMRNRIQCCGPGHLPPLGRAPRGNGRSREGTWARAGPRSAGPIVQAAAARGPDACQQRSCPVASRCRRIAARSRFTSATSTSRDIPSKSLSISPSSPQVPRANNSLRPVGRKHLNIGALWNSFMPERDMLKPYETSVTAFGTRKRDFCASPQEALMLLLSVVAMLATGALLVLGV